MKISNISKKSAFKLRILTGKKTNQQGISKFDRESPALKCKRQLRWI